MTNWQLHTDQQRLKRIFRYALILSLITHVILTLVFWNSEAFRSANVTKRPDEKIRIRIQPARPTKMPKQIVEVDEVGRKEKPKDSKFLGKTDRTVDRQSVAQTSAPHKAAGKGKRDAVSKRPAKQTVAKAKKAKKTQKRQQDKIKRVKSKAPKKLSFKDLSMGKKLAMTPTRTPSASQAQGLKTGQRDKTGLAQSNDFVEEIPLGDVTALNTVEYKYYGFFYRIKKRLEQYWGASIQDKAKGLYKSGRSIASGENFITSLTIVLDDKGKIVDIQLKGTSGLKELDDAAVDSFNKAGPFPNPPQGLIKDGRAQIQWGFVVKS